MKAAVRNVREQVAGPREAVGGFSQGYVTPGLYLSAKSGVQKTLGLTPRCLFPIFAEASFSPDGGDRGAVAAVQNESEPFPFIQRSPNVASGQLNVCRARKALLCSGRSLAKVRGLPWGSACTSRRCFTGPCAGFQVLKVTLRPLYKMKASPFDSFNASQTLVLDS